MTSAMLGADWGTGEVFVTILWFFMLALWVGMILYIFVDVVRSNDLSGWAKALWLLLVIIFPLFGAFAYLVVRGGPTSSASTSGTPATEIVTMTDNMTTADVLSGRINT